MKKKILSFVMALSVMINLIPMGVKADANPILKGEQYRPTCGSNYWSTSNLREWLNNNSAKVNYTCQAPTADKLGNNAYDQDDGFLSEFTSDEQNAIAVTKHRVFVSWDDQNVAVGGNIGTNYSVNSTKSLTFDMSDNLPTNWRNFNYKTDNDKVYLLNTYEAYLYLQKRGFSLSKQVTNAVSGKYNYSGSQDWYIQYPISVCGYDEEQFVNGNGTIQQSICNNLIGVVPTINVKPSYIFSDGRTASNLNIGDIVTFGRHLGEPIEWQVVNKQNGYPMLVSTKIVDMKVFDSPGDYSYEYSNYINFSSTDIDLTSEPYVSSDGSSDTTAPTIKVNNQNQLNTRQNDSFTLNLTASDDSGVKDIELPDGTITTNTNFNYIITQNGEYLFIARDVHGNYNYFIVPVGNINTPPQIDITSSANEWTNKNVSVNINASNNVGFTADTINQNYRDYTGSVWPNYTSYAGKKIEVSGNVEFVSADKPLDGISIAAGVAYRYAGMNGSEYSENPTWPWIWSIPLQTLKDNGKQHFDAIYTVPGNYFDDLQPWLTIPVNVGVYDYTIKWSNIQYKLLDNDDFAIKNITLPNGQTINQKSYTDTLTQDGDYVYSATATNGATASKTISVKIDKVPPTINITGAPTSYVNTDVLLTINASDDKSGVNYITLPNGQQAYSSSTTFNVRQSGNYTFSVTDNAGNTTSKTVNVLIDKNPPALSLTENTIGPADSVTILAGSSDSQSGVKSITRPDGTVVNGSSASYTVNQNGTYTFTATDNVGNISTQSITINNIKDIKINSVSSSAVDLGHLNPLNSNGLSSVILNINSNYGYNLYANTSSNKLSIKNDADSDYVNLSSSQTIEFGRNLSAGTSDQKIDLQLSSNNDWNLAPGIYSIPVTIIVRQNN